MDHARIIDMLVAKLGSQRDVGAWFGVDHSTVSHWRNGDGIPSRYWPEMLRVARNLRIPLTLEDIELHSPLRAA